MHLRTPALRIGALGGICLLLGGCFSEGGNSGDSAQRIHVAMAGVPKAELSPHSDDAFMLTRWQSAETLTSMQPDGSIAPMLATSWKQRDDRTWEFTIRDGVKFHNGSELNAAAVVTALQAAAKANPAPRPINGLKLEVRDVSTDDAQIVQVSADKAVPLMPELLSSSQLVILAPEAYGSRVDAIEHGTGAFVLRSLNADSSATLERNENYWDGEVQAEGIEASFVPDGNGRTAALRSQNTNVVEAIPLAQIKQLESQELITVQQPRIAEFLLNTRSGAFSDPALRAQAAEALNKQAIAQEVFFNQDPPTDRLLSSAVPWAKQFQKPVELPKAANPDKKKITIATYSDRPELPEALLRIAADLEAAGFEVEQEVRSYANLEQDALDGKFDAVLLSRSVLLDSGDPVGFFTSDFSCDGEYNMAQLCNAEVDELIAKAEALDAGEQRQKAAVAAEQAILDTGAVIPVVEESVIIGSDKVEGVVADPYARYLIDKNTRLK
ncbi:ABC transporter substrate-binding protein [Corynebacterium pseudopelargi]|uniref:Heme-binding protein A n=1 Tax=Corynebacterium pseudopelargi TaxID=2080757 RepID=A0A3G6IRN1_9CORY|nr:ABC transporter substrate-binding protein [Corynebacterium pseudopelargi]AZA08187.1 Heme-binding protein A precursor [Corynebacterium pseudopelargi]